MDADEDFVLDWLEKAPHISGCAAEFHGPCNCGKDAALEAAARCFADEE